MSNPRRRRCAICRKLTINWQRINGSAWHCYDGCYSTTGYDRRTLDGRVLNPPDFWDFKLTDEETATRKNLQKQLEEALEKVAVQPDVAHPAEEIIQKIMQGPAAEQLLQSVALISRPRISIALLQLLRRQKPFDEHWRARIIYHCLHHDSESIRKLALELARSWEMYIPSTW